MASVQLTVASTFLDDNGSLDGTFWSLVQGGTESPAAIAAALTDSDVASGIQRVANIPESYLTVYDPDAALESALAEPNRIRSVSAQWTLVNAVSASTDPAPLFDVRAFRNGKSMGTRTIAVPAGSQFVGVTAWPGTTRLTRDEVASCVFKGSFRQVGSSDILSIRELALAVEYIAQGTFSPTVSMNGLFVTVGLNWSQAEGLDPVGARLIVVDSTATDADGNTAGDFGFNPTTATKVLDTRMVGVGSEAMNGADQFAPIVMAEGTYRGYVLVQQEWTTHPDDPWYVGWVATDEFTVSGIAVGAPQLGSISTIDASGAVEITALSGANKLTYAESLCIGLTGWRDNGVNLTTTTPEFHLDADGSHVVDNQTLASVVPGQYYWAGLKAWSTGSVPNVFCEIVWYAQKDTDVWTEFDRQVDQAGGSLVGGSPIDLYTAGICPALPGGPGWKLGHPNGAKARLQITFGAASGTPQIYFREASLYPSLTPIADYSLGGARAWTQGMSTEDRDLQQLHVLRDGVEVNQFNIGNIDLVRVLDHPVAGTYDYSLLSTVDIQLGVDQRRSAETAALAVTLTLSDAYLTDHTTNETRKVHLTEWSPTAVIVDPKVYEPVATYDGLAGGIVIDGGQRGEKGAGGILSTTVADVDWLTTVLAASRTLTLRDVLGNQWTFRLTAPASRQLVRRPATPGDSAPIANVREFRFQWRELRA